MSAANISGAVTLLCVAVGCVIGLFSLRSMWRYWFTVGVLAWIPHAIAAGDPWLLAASILYALFDIVYLIRWRPRGDGLHSNSRHAERAEVLRGRTFRLLRAALRPGARIHGGRVHEARPDCGLRAWRLRGVRRAGAHRKSGSGRTSQKGNR